MGRRAIARTRVMALGPSIASPIRGIMEGKMIDQLASDLYVAAICAIGFTVWIVRDVTTSVLGHIGKPAHRRAGGLPDLRS
jgi:hypothetical protein